MIALSHLHGSVCGAGVVGGGRWLRGGGHVLLAQGQAALYTFYLTIY